LSTPALLFSLYTAPPTPAPYTLSLHDALPISSPPRSNRSRDRPKHLRPPTDPAAGDLAGGVLAWLAARGEPPRAIRHLAAEPLGDRKSTRLNSSHDQISYAVFCLKKKKKNKTY